MLLALVVACSKTTEHKCFKANGAKAVLSIEIPDINYIEITDEFDVHFIQDSLDYIQVNSFENLLSFYNFDVTDKKLFVSDGNGCYWSRKKKRATLSVHFTRLDSIAFNNHGVISSELIQQDSIRISSNNSSPIFDLHLNTDHLHLTCVEGSAVGSLKGSTSSAYIFQSEYSKITASEFVVDRLHVSNKSAADMIVKFADMLYVELHSTGNVRYLGDKNSTNLLIQSSSGELIQE